MNVAEIFEINITNKEKTHPGKITCSANGDFKVKLNTQPTNLCYKTPNSAVSLPIPPSGEIGPFTNGTEVVISPAPCGTNPTCFKVIYLPKPDCKNPNIEISQGRVKNVANELNLKIVPNPFSNDQLTIKADINIVQDVMYLIYNTSGQLIQTGKFKGQEQVIPFNQPSGMYIINFKDNVGNRQSYKFIKL